MAFASMENSDDNQPIAEINMVPLIDVMLVLLIIFMVTAPLLTHSVEINLPKAASTSSQNKVENVQLAINADSEVFWNGEAVNGQQLAERLQAASRLQPQPELHIRAERTTPYEKVAQIMSEAARQNLLRIGFVTDPSSVR